LIPGPSLPLSSRAGDLRGPAGALEALIEPPEGEATGAAIVCHPHPLHGGTMHNKVVFRAARGAVEAGFHALRFNFRGVGRSEGIHDEGRGEVDDARAALELVARLVPGRPLVAAGFSFGAWIALRAGLADRRVAGLVAIGLPLTRADFSFVDPDGRPILVVQGDRDEFGPLVDVRRAVARWGARARLEVLEGAGHFFDGRLGEVTVAVRDFCAGMPGGPRP
jgi:uncharacterized protein